MSSQYIVDKDFRFKKEKASVWTVICRILMFFVASLSLAVVYYVIFSLVFSTDEEKKLRQENRMYAREYPELEEAEAAANRLMISGYDMETPALKQIS